MNKYIPKRKDRNKFQFIFTIKIVQLLEFSSQAITRILGVVSFTLIFIHNYESLYSYFLFIWFIRNLQFIIINIFVCFYSESISSQYIVSFNFPYITLFWIKHQNHIFVYFLYSINVFNSLINYYYHYDKLIKPHFCVYLLLTFQIYQTSGEKHI